jgi:PilZ domain
MKDKKIMRYAPYPRGHRAFFTEIINLSESGMAFTVPFLDSPQVNETIMVEFTIPDAAPMACFAKVKRVQKYTLIESDFFHKDCKLVAVKFEKMPDDQLTTLRLSLNDEFKRLQTHFRRKQIWLKLQWYWKFKRTPLIAAAAIPITTTATLLYWLLS